MNKQAILNASDDDYMNSEQLAFFDEQLRLLREQTQNEISSALVDTIYSKVSDINDRATQEEESMIAIRIAERKRQLIPKIDAARNRIKNNEYGYCKQTGEPIGIARLLLRPTAELCIDAKMKNEQKEKLYAH